MKPRASPRGPARAPSSVAAGLDRRAGGRQQGHYDDHEVDRVVRADLDPRGSHAGLSAAIAPVADRLLKAYAAAQGARRAALETDREQEAEDALDRMNALLLFRNDMGTFVRIYSFLSQIFDYGNTAIEARAIFFRKLIPLLDFGRERTEVDVSKVVLTHHKLASKGTQRPQLGGEAEPLKPMTAAGSGSIQDKEKALLDEILARVNDLFQGELTDGDQLIYVNNVIKGKLLESETLVQQAAHNSKEQFSSSPALKQAITNAIIDAFDAHSAMSKQALDSYEIREGLREILLGPAQLYELLRARGGHSSSSQR